MSTFSLVLFAALKYVFLFVGDGMATPQRMVAEEFSLKAGCGRLAMNSLPYRASTCTRSGNSLITDSAASATAIACGEKTGNGMLGVAPDGRRLESVAEVAKKRGMKVGIITTVAIGHATPGGFFAHRRSRGLYYQIGLDLVASGFDHFAGAGLFGRHDDRGDVEYRGNIFELANAAGYKIARTREEWAALKPGGLSWCVFGDSSMDFDIDDRGRNPRLHELLEKSIELLDNPGGFFIMCEGGKIDYAGHANDAASNLRDVLALDRAVKIALEFYDRHPEETLVITTGDHETGGMTMGFAGTGSTFDVGKLAAQNISVEAFSSKIKKFISKKNGAVTFADVEPMLKDNFGLDSFSAQEIKKLSEALDKDVGNVKSRLADTTAHNVKRRYVFAQAVKNVLNARAGIGWNTHSHTAMPTMTTAKGCGAEILKGMTDNTEIGIRLKRLVAGGR